MRIVFFGSPQFATEILRIVERECEIVAVVTQPDRPFGRKQILKACDVKEYAMQKEYPIFQPQALDSVLLEQLLQLKPDLFLVVAFGQIFPSEFLDSTLCLNVHASLLPHLRGASPLQEMILEERREFGVTLMKMQEGLDEGDIFGVSYLKIAENPNLQSLQSHLSRLGGKLTLKVLKNLSNLNPIPQNHCDSSICKKIKKQAGLIDFSTKFYAKFLAFNPWPSIFLSSGLKILSLKMLQESSRVAYGKIVRISEVGVCISSVEGVVEILEVQPESKQKMSALDYVRGKRLGIGDEFC